MIREVIISLLLTTHPNLGTDLDKLWVGAQFGRSPVESALVVRPGGNSKLSSSMGGERHRRSITWYADGVAIIHTHPDDKSPLPSLGDTTLADRLRVPVCTATGRGFYCYDPASRKTIKLFDSINWLRDDAWLGK